ncbi:hypothetical protein [Propionibacterium sp.]|uniref:hypothetical protein n=1 Tax=Propionibacterium sp. TaxID=1977903 RepID=UPI0039E83395
MPLRQGRQLGDGAADVKPIAHLYKSQVYQLAEYRGSPPRSASAPPRPTPIRCRSPRRSSTSHFPISGWTCACTARTMVCRSIRSPGRPG